MYVENERNEFFEHIVNCIKKSKNIIGGYVIGSAAIGFRDIYSDCDFMLAYKEENAIIDVRNEILSFFANLDIGYITERKWSDKIWGISVYLKNGISTDISFGPLKELKISSNQIKVAVDTVSCELQKHLDMSKQSLGDRTLFKFSNVSYEFMYLIRKFKIAIKRFNYIYAYQLLGDARLIVMKIEGLNENKKLHEFKAYNELDDNFLERIKQTIPKDLSKAELESCGNVLLELFLKVISNSKLKHDENLKYLLEIAD